MDKQEDDSLMVITKPMNTLSFLNGLPIKHSAWFEIRLFYVRVSPCVIGCLPDHLRLCVIRGEIGVAVEINGSRIPSSEAASLTLRRDRVDKESLEVTYVTTDNVRLTGGVEFEVYEKDGLILCGSLERMESNWTNGNSGLGNNSKAHWSMDCHMAMSISSGTSAFFQPKLGVSAPAMEVYIAGCCSGRPVILTKTIQMSPRRKGVKHAMLDAIPEDEESEKDQSTPKESFRHRKQQSAGSDVDEYEFDRKVGHGCYSEDMYYEDGQLSWFNAGVRVGVGIGLGMCVGLGFGVGLLMRSYRATTRDFRKRLF